MTNAVVQTVNPADAAAVLARLVARELTPLVAETPPAALPPAAAAAYCGMSRSTWDTYHAAGLVPAGLRVGGKLVWCRAELDAWLAHGAPPRDEWEPLWRAVRRDVLRGPSK